MTWAIALAAAAVIAVVGVGVVRPFGRPRRKRLAAGRSARRGAGRPPAGAGDLDEERRAGQLDDEDFRALRADTERRAVAVLRAIDARDGGDELGAGLAEIRSANRTSPNDRPGGDPVGASSPGPWGRWWSPA